MATGGRPAVTCCAAVLLAVALLMISRPGATGSARSPPPPPLLRCCSARAPGLPVACWPMQGEAHREKRTHGAQELMPSQTRPATYINQCHCATLC